MRPAITNAPMAKAMSWVSLVMPQDLHMWKRPEVIWMPLNPAPMSPFRISWPKIGHTT